MKFKIGQKFYSIRFEIKTVTKLSDIGDGCNLMREHVDEWELENVYESKNELIEEVIIQLNKLRENEEFINAGV